MEITDLYRYGNCMAVQAHINTIETLLNTIQMYIEEDIIGEKTDIDDECIAYILTARKLMKTIGMTMADRARPYMNDTKGEQK